MLILYIKNIYQKKKTKNEKRKRDQKKNQSKQEGENAKRVEQGPITEPNTRAGQLRVNNKSSPQGRANYAVRPAELLMFDAVPTTRFRINRRLCSVTEIEFSRLTNSAAAEILLEIFA